jgi:hypothetical protein
MQVFIQEITNHVGATLQGLVQQSIAQIEKTMSPSGRPVVVARLNTDRNPENRHTTTPQLLAELNDNLIDLVDELRDANDLVRQQMDGAGGGEYEGRRRRKRR